ncbi:MAG TPA: phosphoribosylglycinamide synthetase C domain-containing protein, partial [Bacillota bacterium]|nr:phosphoribosylglycinamide synthetase C domain-containing protein [Bacillota bacterium]
TDLFTIMRAVTEGRLGEIEVKFRKGYSCCVVMASAGYPRKYQTGYPISIDESVIDSVYVAGAKLSADGRQLLTSGGRVLNVVHVADTLEEAIKGAYEKVAKIKFENEYHRHDIGKKALMALK